MIKKVGFNKPKPDANTNSRQDRRRISFDERLKMLGFKDDEIQKIRVLIQTSDGNRYVEWLISIAENADIKRQILNARVVSKPAFERVFPMKEFNIKNINNHISNIVKNLTFRSEQLRTNIINDIKSRYTYLYDKTPYNVQTNNRLINLIRVLKYLFDYVHMVYAEIYNEEKWIFIKMMTNIYDVLDNVWRTRKVDNDEIFRIDIESYPDISFETIFKNAFDEYKTFMAKYQKE